MKDVYAIFREEDWLPLLRPLVGLSTLSDALCQ